LISDIGLVFGLVLLAIGLVLSHRPGNTAGQLHKGQRGAHVERRSWTSNMEKDIHKEERRTVDYEEEDPVTWNLLC